LRTRLYNKTINLWFQRFSFVAVKKNAFLNIILLFILSSNISFAQEKVVTFGIQLKPIIPLGFFDTGEQFKTSNGIDFTLTPKTGLGFGMVIRKGFTKSLSIETGINLIRRNYNLTIADADSNLTIESSFKMSNYEIPVLGLVYVQLGEQLFMNVSGGFSLDIYPTDLRTGGQGFGYSNDLIRNDWINASLLANIGWEYRTEKSGYLYFGASLHRPFRPIFKEYIVYDSFDRNETMQFDLSGNYFTIDIRYFFHEEKQKKKKKKKKEEKKVFIDPRK
jgi:hypothetical protein